MSRRLLQVVGLLSLLLIGVVANSALRDDESALELNPVAAAAARAESYPGFRFKLDVVYSSPALPGPINAHGTGAYNGDTGRTLTTLSLNIPTTGPVDFVEVSDDTYDYEKSSIYGATLPPGKEWVRTETDEDSDEAELDFDEAMEILLESGEVHVVGRQSVNGTMAVGYSTEIPMSKLVELLREQGNDDAADTYESLEGVEGLTSTGISAEVWVDRKNLLRRMRFVMAAPGEDGAPPMSMDMRMDLFDFGARPDIRLPDPDTVVDGPLDSSIAPTSTSAS